MLGQYISHMFHIYMLLRYTLFIPQTQKLYIYAYTHTYAHIYTSGAYPCLIFDTTH